MAVVIDESAVPGLKVCFNPVIVRETRDKEDAILECLDGRRFAVVRRDLAINSGFFKCDAILYRNNDFYVFFIEGVVYTFFWRQTKSCYKKERILQIQFAGL